VEEVKQRNLVAFDLAREIVENVLNGIILEDHAVPLVARIKAHDEYSYTHILNVSTLSLAMGRLLGLDHDQLRVLGQAALLHDTGKLMVPSEILQKQGDLTAEEFGEIRMHPVRGAAVLMKIRGVPDLVPIVAFEHHIRTDGSGYPSRPGGRRPHLASRLVAIADVFDALRTNRAYRTEFSKEETLRRMAGMPLDPELFNVFARLASLYTEGDHVRLDTGEIGVVVAINPRDALRPCVEVRYGADGSRLPAPQRLDLSWSRERQIMASLDLQQIEALG